MGWRRFRRTAVCVGSWDRVSPAALQRVFGRVFEVGRRYKALTGFQALGGHYLLAVDGTGQFASERVHCDTCCVKWHRDGRMTYYHQLLAAVLVHPSESVVVPLAPEPVLKSDGATKNNCEQQAASRLLPAIRRAHPHLKMVVLQDALAATQWHSFSGFFHSVKDSVLGLGYPLIFYSVSELPVPVLLFLAATFRPVFGIAVHRTGPDGAVTDTGRSRRPYESRFPGGRMHAEVAGSRCCPPPPQVRA